MLRILQMLCLCGSMGLVACTNYDLLDKLENPGGKETFTDRLIVFVTSQMTAGDMFALNAGSCNGTGIGKADCVCQALAAQNGLRRSSTSKFLAWLSISGAPMNCRFANAMGVSCPPSGTQVWYNTNFEPVFQGIESATTGLMGSTPGLPNAIKYAENRFLVPNTTDDVWTGTTAGGAIGSTCADWQSFNNLASGTVGQSHSFGPAWTSTGGTVTCDQFKRIYCVAVP